MNRLALGTAQFGQTYGIANRSGQVLPDEAASILELASQHGIDTLDTAIAYGESEQTLGSIGVQGWRVISKLPELPHDCTDIPGWIERQIDGSLGRLGLSKLHALLLHRPAQLLAPGGDALIRTLEKAEADGRIGKVGVSIYDPAELEPLEERIASGLIQAPFNLLDNRLVASGWADRLKHRGIELHTRSAFLQGLLLMRDADRPEKFAAFAPVWHAWRAYLQRTGQTPLAACLSFVFSTHQIDRVVVGVDSRQHLAEILQVPQQAEPLRAPDWPAPLDPRLLNPSNWSQL